MARTAEDILRATIGNLTVQLAIATARNEELEEKVQSLESQSTKE